VGEDPSAVGPDVAATPETERLKAQIEETREELGDTVAALARKTDVKAQAKEKVEDAKARAKERVDEVKERAGAVKDDVAEKVQERTPEPVQARAQQAAEVARDNRRPIAIAAAVAAAFLMLRRLLFRRHDREE
jgi:gas vesicle protein